MIQEVMYRLYLYHWQRYYHFTEYAPLEVLQFRHMSWNYRPNSLFNSCVNISWYICAQFDNPHVTCAVSIIIFFICCQCSFTSRFCILLPLPYLWPCFGIFHVFSSLSFHTHTLGSNFLCHLFVVLNRMSITNNLCFGTRSSFAVSLKVTGNCAIR